jgi:hypothetical protein
MMDFHLNLFTTSVNIFQKVHNVYNSIFLSREQEMPLKDFGRLQMFRNDNSSNCE